MASEASKPMDTSWFHVLLVVHLYCFLANTVTQVERKQMVFKSMSNDATQ